ncbi:probable CCR4-associated factor 1 homolog 11 [Typha angustifolia]|uniref:probable CCR4-associated factor 1 homolog 11 n=1 Tax=Typha angustifolia TaxID=59011 RepID=UPI003C2F08E9
MEMEKCPVVVRSVWTGNAEYEFSLIRSVVGEFPFASMDTEFPGVIYVADGYHPSQLTPEERYTLIKANVDELQLLQVGITLTDAEGRLPDLGTDGAKRYVWEINIGGFDLRYHPHNPESIELLRCQGIDFELLRCCGINSAYLGQLLMRSGLLCNTSVKWVTFHSAYDFAYLIKILIGGNRGHLPDDMGEFMNHLDFFFGTENVYDMKHMMRHCDGLYGGLEKMASLLDVRRAAGLSHQAGSDALLTAQVFRKLREMYFADGGVDAHAGVIFGLQAN